ncbi:MAG: N-formylglutamate amidohydrolase [bacterium]
MILPVLISIPHGGDQIPPEVEDRICLSPSDVFHDGDSLTKTIFGFQGQVAALLEASVARVVVDLNREPGDRPPENPDGVVKTMTLKGIPVYGKKKGPEESLIQTLLTRYYYPYHQKLDQLADKRGIRIALDCHSMLPQSPTFNSSPGRKRPAICLSNGGGRLGHPLGNGKPVTCNPETIQQMAECFKEAFEIPDTEVMINHPFNGGHIIRSHCRGSIPWVRVEVNKKLYLPLSNRKQTAVSYSEAKINHVREKIWMALKLFFLNF